MGKPACRDKSTGLTKRPWTAEEDQKLLHYISKHGHGRWRTVPNNAGLQRCGKSCRLRWTNYLRPDIKRGRFSVEEEDTIIQLHSVLGNKWSLIASRLPGRTDNEIKNYWNTHIRKRLLKQDNLRLDLLQLCSFHNSSSLQNYPEFMQFIHFPQVHQCQYHHPFPASTSSNTSSISLLNTLLVQGNMEQQQVSPSFFNNLSSKNYVPSLCQNINGNDQSTYNLGQSVVSPSGSINENPSLVQLLGAPDQNQMLFQFNSINNNNAKNFDQLGSVISTPSAGHVNGSTEDEKDTYCNNNNIMFDYHMAFDFHGLS